LIPEFPDRLHRYAEGYFGEDGKVWLVELPDILKRCCKKWGLELGPIMKEIKANYVGHARMADGQEVVIKVGVPRFVQPEMGMLEIYDGRGINRMIDCDLNLSAMLLERFRPGTMLRKLNDSREQARITGRIVRELHQTPAPQTHDFKHRAKQLEKSIADASLCTDLERSRPFLYQLARLKSMMDVLIATEPQILLHGDLHHFNILLDEARGWTAIDPQSRIGPSCLEFGTFVGNAGDDEAPISEERKTIVEAIEMLSEASGESEDRVYAGAFFEYVLWTSRAPKDEPTEHEEAKRQKLDLFLEIGGDVDLEKIGK
jgi:streptomycin 6-kinase